MSIAHIYGTNAIRGLLLKNLGFSCYCMVKNPPAKQQMWVQSLGWEDALVKEMATNSNIVAWEIPWTEEPRGL